MSTPSPDSDDTYERRAGEPTGIARCSALDDSEPPYTVHGVAIGADDVTMGKHGPKFWPAAELRRAVSTLVGVPLTKNHDDERVESVVGEVVDAGYEDGVGIVYEAEVDESELATKIARGRLEVSIHAGHTNGGHTEDGAMIAENIRFLDLSVVPRGAAPSNSVESGASASEALASLSADDVGAMLGHDATTAGSEHGDAPGADGQSPRTPSDATTSTMTETNSEELDEADADAEEASLDESPEAEDVEEAELDDGTDIEAEADADEEAELTDEPEAGEDVEDASAEAELQDEITELRAENEELRQELESVRMEYAERLADDGPFTAAELSAQFSFDTLQEKFESQEASLASADETPGSTGGDVPAPQAGDASTEEELSTTTEDNAEQIASLEAKVEKYDEIGWDNAKADAEAKLAELDE